MSSRQGTYVPHGYLIEEICQTYPDLNQELEMRMLEFRAQFPTKYRDWYHHELLPALRKLQQRQWSHSTTPESFSRRHNGYQSRHDQSQRHEQSYRQEQKRQDYSRSHSRIVQGESMESPDSDACYKKFHLPHMVCKVISNRCVLYGQGKTLAVTAYPTHVPQSQYVTNLDTLKELIPFEDKKCFYEYLQTYIDQSTHLSEKLLYQLVLLHLKLKAQTEPTDISELLLNEYRKLQGEQFLRYVARDSDMSRDQFMSQPQDSLTLSREQFISQDLTREDFTSRDAVDAQDEDKILHRLRKLLLNGSKHKALRWAVENQEWVSALFIASSMDRDSYLAVCGLYIQSIPRSDPLRTCLQVQFGLDIDYQYGDDWGVHLAAILNNTQDAGLIVRFANTVLGGVSDICGQHFCYISARIAPSSNKGNSPYVLVGAENHLLGEQIPIQSVMLTMAYDNTLPHLQYYKYEVALNYIRMGVYELGLCLLQNIASVFLNGSVVFSSDTHDLVSYVYDLSLHIYNRVNSQHAVWINSLGDLLHSQPQYEVQPVRGMSPDPCVQEAEPPSLGYEPTGPTYYSYTDQQRHETQEHIPVLSVRSYASEDKPVPIVEPTSYQEELPDTAPHIPTQEAPTEPAPTMPAFYVPSYDASQGDSGSQDVAQPPPGPDMSNVGSISIHSKFTFAEDKTDSPPESTSKPAVAQQNENSAKPDVKPQAEKSQTARKEAQTGGKGSSSGSWLSFLKFARPKNQMILPDDDKPSIVWDESKKMWVDVNSDGKSGPSSLPPPPKSSPMVSTQPQMSDPPAPMNNTAPAPFPLPNPNPLAQNGPGPMKMNSQNGFRKGKAKYVNVLASNR